MDGNIWQTTSDSPNSTRFPLPKIRAIRYFIQTGGSALIRCFVENLYLLHHTTHSPSQLHQVDIIVLRDIAISPRSTLADLIMDAMTSSVKSCRIYCHHEAWVHRTVLPPETPEKTLWVRYIINNVNYILLKPYIKETKCAV